MSKKYTILLLLIFAVISSKSYAQNEARPWYVPDHYKAQFAGNIGFISIGAGYLHAKEKMETDLYVGYLPKKIGGDDIIAVTGKTTYYPWNIKIDDNYSLKPFSIGAYLSYSFGSQFDTILPDVYPKGYYWWASSLRFGAFFGGKVTKTLPQAAKFKNISLYYELSTYDLEAISYLQNMDYLSVTDIFSLSLGVKLGL